MPRSRRRRLGPPYCLSDSSLALSLSSSLRRCWGDGCGRRSLRRASAGLAAAVLLAVLAGCSDDADLDPGPSSPARLTNTPASTPTPTQTPVAPAVTIVPSAEGIAANPVVVGFRNYLDARFDAMRALDEQSPGLLGTATGKTLAADQDIIRQARNNGWRLVGVPKWSIIGVRNVDDSRVSVVACQWDSSVYFADQNTGRPVSPVEDVWLPIEVWMLRSGATWAAESDYDASHTCAEAR